MEWLRHSTPSEAADDHFWGGVQEQPGLVQPSRRLSPLIASVGTLATIGVLAGGILLGSHFRVQRVGAQIPTPYADVSSYLTIITTEERAGQWKIAAINAESAIRQGGFAPADMQSLKEHAIDDKLRALAAETFPAADAGAQQQAVDDYDSDKRLAQEYGQPIESLIGVAQDAYSTGHFLLAKTAFEDALARGDISLTDQLQVKFYCSTLYNLGWWYAERGATSDIRDLGLAYLSASYAIDNRYQVGSGAAWGELTKLLGPQGWPPPAQTPLLGTGSQQTMEVTNGAPR